MSKRGYWFSAGEIAAWGTQGSCRGYATDDRMEKLILSGPEGGREFRAAVAALGKRSDELKAKWTATSGGESNER